MAEDDFELDLYGDGSYDGADEQYGDYSEQVDTNEAQKGTSGTDIKEQDQTSPALDGEAAVKQEDDGADRDMASETPTTADNSNAQSNESKPLIKTAPEEEEEQIKKQSSTPAEVKPQVVSVQQGVKRKEGYDERAVEHGASSAITISELNWWNTDDEIRGWAKHEGCESELKDVTFSEHKVNGKSKGQAYIEFESPQAATAVKKHIEALASAAPATIKFTVVYASPATNPFRTLPKNDANRHNTNTGPRGNMNSPNHIRGNRGGRGGMINANGGNFNNRGGFQNNSMGGMQGGGFGGQMGGAFGAGGGGGPNSMGGFQNNFGNRGGMMGGNMRGGGGNMGGRGGRGGFSGMPNFMGGINMMASQLGNMANQMAHQFNPMAMNNMGNFGAQGHINPAFLQGAGQQMQGQHMGNQQMGNQQMGGQQMGNNNDWNNPHGAKRPRGE